MAKISGSINHKFQTCWQISNGPGSISKCLLPLRDNLGGNTPEPKSQDLKLLPALFKSKIHKAFALSDCSQTPNILNTELQSIIGDGIEKK